MQELEDELKQHVELMFLTLDRTLRDILNIYGVEFTKAIQSIADIHDELFQRRQKKDASIDTDEFFAEIEGEYIKNRGELPYSFGLTMGPQQIEAILAPLSDISIYHQAIESLKKLGCRPTTFDEKIYYIACGLRFYLEAAKNQIITLDDGLSCMLRIDRALSFIREDIAAFMATSRARQTNPIGITKSHIAGNTNRIDRDQEIKRAFLAIQRSEGEEEFSLNRLKNKIAKKMPDSISIDPKTVGTRLSVLGITREILRGKKLKEIELC
jgi:hypothetical protein